MRSDLHRVEQCERNRLYTFVTDIGMRHNVFIASGFFVTKHKATCRITLFSGNMYLIKKIKLDILQEHFCVPFKDH